MNLKLTNELLVHNVNSSTIKNSKLSNLIDYTLLRECIINKEAVARENIMNKREAIIKKHIKEVYPLRFDERSKLHYTKLHPNVRGHEGKISSKSLVDLKEKIIAYYLDIEYKNKTTVEDILNYAIAELTPETASRHRQLFNKHFYMLKDIKIAELGENDIRACLQAMIDKGIKSKAFNNATSTLNKINDYCVYNHISTVNIREKVSDFRKYKLVGKKIFLKDDKKDTELSFTEAEALKIIQYAINNPDYINLAIATLITTGLRAGELLALRPEDINLSSGKMIVDKMEKTKSYEIVNRCKDDSDRTVFLNADARLILKKVFEIRECDNTDNEFLFLNDLSDDGKLHLRALDNRLRKIQHTLSFTTYASERSPHDCRRTYASIQYLHGVDVKTIQKQLGHSTTEMTWEYIKDIIDANTRCERLQKGCILSA